MKVPFKVAIEELSCLTPCPNGKNPTVYSEACQKCEYYVSTDIEHLIVDCNFAQSCPKSTLISFNGNTFRMSVECGCLNLKILDKKGEEWCIAGINKAGVLELYSDLPENLELNLTPNRTIKTISE